MSSCTDIYTHPGEHEVLKQVLKRDQDDLTLNKKSRPIIANFPKNHFLQLECVPLPVMFAVYGAENSLLLLYFSTTFNVRPNDLVHKPFPTSPRYKLLRDPPTFLAGTVVAFKVVKPLNEFLISF